MGGPAQRAIMATISMAKTANILTIGIRRKRIQKNKK
jgi:hypothetical protein